MNAIESVERRERRLERSRKRFVRFEHAYRAMGTYCLHYIVGSEAVWDAVRRVATEILVWPTVQDVATAWGIVHYVKGLPDGEKRLKAALESAMAKWEAELR